MLSTERGYAKSNTLSPVLSWSATDTYSCSTLSTAALSYSDTDVTSPRSVRCLIPECGPIQWGSLCSSLLCFYISIFTLGTGCSNFVRSWNYIVYDVSISHRMLKLLLFRSIYCYIAYRFCIIGWGSMLRAGRSRVRDSMFWLFFFNVHNPSSPTRPIQPVTEMSTRDRKIMFLGSRTRQGREADNLTAICEPTVWTLWDP
jgi:hypothetical protein